MKDITVKACKGVSIIQFMYHVTFSTKCTNCMCDHILTIVTWFSTSMITKCVFCYPEALSLAIALAVTEAWKGINKSKLYDELGWKYLSERRRRLTHFHKLIHLNS